MGSVMGSGLNSSISMSDALSTRSSGSVSSMMKSILIASSTILYCCIHGF